MLKKKNRLYLLGAILLMAFLLRFLAFQHGYPPNHPDEPVVWSVAYSAIKNQDLNPHRFDYPMFSMVANAFSYLVFFIPLSLTKAVLLNTGAFLANLGNLQVFLDTFVLRGEFSPVLMWGRLVSVFWGTATILMVYLMVKEAFDDLAGLIAAFLMSFNYRHLIASTLTLPDVFNTFLITSAFWVFLRLWRSPSRRLYFWAGVLMGLVMATKYQAMIGLPFLLVHSSLSLNEKKWPKVLRNFLSPDFFLAFFPAVLIFFLINPFILITPKEAYDWISWGAMRYEAGVFGLRLTPFWYLYKVVLTPPLAWLAFLGVLLGLWLKKERFKTCLFLSFLLAVFFMLSVYTHGVFYGRNFTPCLPFLLGLAGLLIARISRNKLVLAFFLALLLGFFSVKNSLATAYYWSKDWNLSCARDWMVKNLPGGSRVGIVSPTPMDAFVGGKNSYVSYEPRYAFTLPEVQEEKLDYLVINLNPLGVYTIHWFTAGNFFRGMPMAILDNSLVGLTLKEMSRYSVKDCTKPWPVPDHNFIVVKVPPRSAPSSFKLVKTYFLDEGGEGQNGLSPDWQVVNILGSDLSGFSWEKSQACRQGGCLKIEAGMSYIHKPARLVSAAIPITPGKKYLVEGWIRPDKELPEDGKDGFLRLDFYENQALANGQRGLVAAVSDRAQGESEWQKKRVEAVAPQKASFMRISFQHGSAISGFWLDEISLFEAEATQEELIIANKAEIDGHHIYSETLF